MGYKELYNKLEGKELTDITMPKIIFDAYYNVTPNEIAEVKKILHCLANNIHIETGKMVEDNLMNGLLSPLRLNVERSELRKMPSEDPYHNIPLKKYILNSKMETFGETHYVVDNVSLDVIFSLLESYITDNIVKITLGIASVSEEMIYDPYYEHWHYNHRKYRLLPMGVDYYGQLFLEIVTETGKSQIVCVYTYIDEFAKIEDDYEYIGYKHTIADIIMCNAEKVKLEHKINKLKNKRKELTTKEDIEANKDDIESLKDLLKIYNEWGLHLDKSKQDLEKLIKKELFTKADIDTKTKTQENFIKTLTSYITSLGIDVRGNSD